MRGTLRLGRISPSHLKEFVKWLELAPVDYEISLQVSTIEKKDC